MKYKLDDLIEFKTPLKKEQCFGRIADINEKGTILVTDTVDSQGRPRYFHVLRFQTIEIRESDIIRKVSVLPSKNRYAFEGVKSMKIKDFIKEEIKKQINESMLTKTIGFVGNKYVTSYSYPGKDANLSFYEIDGKKYMGTVRFTSIKKTIKEKY